ncbi:Nfx1-Type Zinc Finger-Containing Protein 1 [Manis pentadactyla]|nr:Nfx1-Type Zinc Finger-Containing Protein 1 [Manis pentadactyla]
MFLLETPCSNPHVTVVTDEKSSLSKLLTPECKALFPLLDRPLRDSAEQDSGQRLVPLGSFRRRRSELIRELKRAPKVGSEVSASVPGQCMFYALFYHKKREEILQ